MPSQPLIVILLLFYLMLLAAALMVWFALTMRAQSGAPVDKTEARTPSQKRAKAKLGAPETKPKVSPKPTNDEVRGVKADPEGRAYAFDEGDPFERFIRSKNDDLKL